MDDQQIGRRIHAQRKQAGLTQEQPAERADLSLAYLSHVERGRKKISLTTLRRIAEALEVPADRLLDVPEAGSTSLFLPAVQNFWTECSGEERRSIFEVAKTLKYCLRGAVM